MTHDVVKDWLDRQVDAWRSNDAATIADHLCEDASWSRYEPNGDNPVRVNHNAALLEFDESGRYTFVHESSMLGRS
jgi:hypothetical protein